jgi:hypothetical protein
MTGMLVNDNPFVTKGSTLRAPFKGALPSDSGSSALEPLKVFQIWGWAEAVLAMPDSPIREERRFVAAARHAAHGAGNPYRLMDGENPDSLQPADAKHWVSIYLELLAFKQKLLDHMYHDLRDMSGPANQEIRRVDVPLIEGEQLRYRKRLRYWQARTRQPARPAPFHSPFQSDSEGHDGDKGKLRGPSERQAAEHEQESPVLVMQSRRRHDDNPNSGG